MTNPKGTKISRRNDNLIFYKWQEIDCVRTFPAQVRQTDATKEAAKNFGKVSSRSKILRNLLAPLISDPKNKDMQVRLKKALLKSLLSTSKTKTLDHPLLGFRFNQSSELKAHLKFDLNITEQAGGKINIEMPVTSPRDSIEAPAGTSMIELHFIAVYFSFENDRCFSMPGFVNIPYSNDLYPAQSVVLKAKSEASGIMVVAVALRFRNQRLTNNKEKYMPAEIVAVFDKR